MRTVLLITGTCGVGKTTTSRAWAAARTGAHINCDEIRNWIRSKRIRHENDYQHQAVARIAATAAEEYLALGIDVVLDFVWKPPMLRYLSQRLSPLAAVKMVWLRCDPSENRRRDGERPANVVMGDRVAELLCELDAIDDWPAELLRIDSTDRTVNDVLAVIDQLTD
jgi:predicted kinase